MQISAIICEYNPFHNGHLYHIEQTRKKGATHIVSIMSGNFVQRGEPAIISKHKRAKIALLNGVDLVVELPVIWAVASAQRFAYAATYIADAFKCINSLSFGSECADINVLTEAANQSTSPLIQNEIKQYLFKGYSFPVARSLAIQKIFGDEYIDIYNKPNNILAIEYINAINSLKSSIEPITIKRYKTLHDSKISKDDIASASNIRESILTLGDEYKKFLPESSYDIIKEEISLKNAPATLMNLQRAILFKLRSMDKKDFLELPDVSEGLNNRIYECVKGAKNIDELLLNIKTKRYTYSRIKRIVLSSVLNITKEMQNLKPEYIKVLAFNEKGLEILNKAKKIASLPIVARANEIFKIKGTALEIFLKEAYATDLYGLMLPQVKECGLEMTLGPINLT